LAGDHTGSPQVNNAAIDMPLKSTFISASIEDRPNQRVMRDLDFGMVRLISLEHNITWYGLMQSDENVSVLCDVRYGTEHPGSSATVGFFLPDGRRSVE